MPVFHLNDFLRWVLLVSVFGILLVLGAWKKSILAQHWGLIVFLLVSVTLLLLYMRFERSSASSREIGVIAVLGTVAALSRVPFGALAHIQPSTFFIIVSGFVFGPRAGFMVGSTTALVSNFFLGQGPWTPYQMFTWGLVGTTAGIIGIVWPNIGKSGMIVFSFIWGYLYGWIMNLWFWTSFVHPLNWKTFIATYAASFFFDTTHAISNVAFYVLLGERVIKVLNRFQKKLLFNINQ